MGLVDLAALRDERGALQCERVHRHVLRVKRNDLFDCVTERLIRVTRQADNEVHIDIRKARFPREVKRIHSLLRRVAAADVFEHVVLQGLRVDADTRNAAFKQRIQLCTVNGIRAAGLYRKFLALRHVERIFHNADHLRKLLCGERRGCAAPDIHSAQV